MKESRALLLVLAMTAGLLGLVAGLRWPLNYLAARHWRNQLDTVADDRAAILLGEVAALGERGIPVLVEALGSQRESVARAAEEQLSEQLSRWQMSGGDGNSRKQAILAEALAQRIEQFGPTAQNDAKELAARILAWMPDSKAIDRPRVIASCETVFRAGERSGGSLAVQGGLAGRAPRQVELLEESAARPTASDPALSEGPFAVMSRLPGGGLPMPPLSGPEGPRTADARVRPPLRPVTPSRGGTPDPLRNWPVAAPDDMAAPDSGQPLLMPDPNEPMPLQPSPRTASDGATRWKQPDRLSELETVDLMRRLHAEDGSAADAQSELARRGFTAVHLELARRMFHPNVEFRKELVRLLPEMQSVDAVPWLLSLCRDADREVRLAAVALLATTGDPALLKQVEEIARHDPDPQIQRQAERLSRQRSGRRY